MLYRIQPQRFLSPSRSTLPPIQQIGSTQVFVWDRELNLRLVNVNDLKGQRHYPLRFDRLQSGLWHYNTCSKASCRSALRPELREDTYHSESQRQGACRCNPWQELLWRDLGSRQRKTKSLAWRSTVMCLSSAQRKRTDYLPLGRLPAVPQSSTPPRKVRKTSTSSRIFRSNHPGAFDIRAQTQACQKLNSTVWQHPAASSEVTKVSLWLIYLPPRGLEARQTIEVEWLWSNFWCCRQVSVTEHWKTTRKVILIIFSEKRLNLIYFDKDQSRRL